MYPIGNGVESNYQAIPRIEERKYLPKAEDNQREY